MPKSHDKKIIKSIIKILRKNPDGLWVSEIARNVKIPQTTVSYYINGVFLKIYKGLTISKLFASQKGSTPNTLPIKLSHSHII